MVCICFFEGQFCITLQYTVAVKLLLSKKHSLFSQFLFTCRVITEDATTFACLLKDLDPPSPLGTIDAVYTSKFSLMDYLEDK